MLRKIETYLVSLIHVATFFINVHFHLWIADNQRVCLHLLDAESARLADFDGFLGLSRAPLVSHVLGACEDGACTRCHWIYYFGPASIVVHLTRVYVVAISQVWVRALAINFKALILVSTIDLTIIPVDFSSFGYVLALQLRPVVVIHAGRPHYELVIGRVIVAVFSFAVHKNWVHCYWLELTFSLLLNIVTAWSVACSWRLAKANCVILEVDHGTNILTHNRIGNLALPGRVLDEQRWVIDWLLLSRTWKALKFVRLLLVLLLLRWNLLLLL